ncbi:MAG: sel1 repeat family protein, partial [Synergistaceae bacterium]|nr:sel1 repeat family protein [Synergistaceae bacterium]
QGHVGAQYMLGVMYCAGVGVREDKSEAVKWYRKAAEQGYVCAQYDLGNMYRYGWGVPKDKSEAVQWYRKAAEQGNYPAKDALKDMGY